MKRQEDPVSLSVCVLIIFVEQTQVVITFLFLLNQGICFFTYHGKVGLASPIDCATSLDANSSACSWTWQATHSEQE